VGIFIISQRLPYTHNPHAVHSASVNHVNKVDVTSGYPLLSDTPTLLCVKLFQPARARYLRVSAPAYVNVRSWAIK